MSKIYYKYGGREITNKKEWKRAHFLQIYPIIFLVTVNLCSIIFTFLQKDKLSIGILGYLSLGGFILAGIIELLLYFAYSKPKYEKWSNNG